MKSSKANVSAYSIDDDNGEAETELETIGRHMAKLKVKSLPRNYQLFHEALYGHDRGIASEIASLGPAPSQTKLDDIGLKHHLVSHCGLVARKSESDAAEMLREVANQLAEGLRKKQRFTREIDAAAPADDAMDCLNASLSNLLLYETELTERLRDCANLPVQVRNTLA
ncbi:hypothetical protein G6L94_06915 [Agrobacterium rhizogenes]|uniref:Uncharacterized protein n=2 Tax=Rhizobium rhizogenes TaxID=359 RepID=B9JCT2_RHIR8|nr:MULTISPECIES: hypothetical protein [Rhizobium]ACM26069.1 conserved hypothetical protein [Rhizobium rhizogenes K84]KAA6491110.1 hypothetical protein DXT98_02890 [Agrobacterium sp. ICMP 7243]OCJ25166.1 hypothetical protein A6U88_01420 [Agrobacterium sp. B131/95]OCJ31678.1 hypothetical protein A6U89_04735 [Agrobacterium sp. B133/95]EJK78758.1 hypothetical protein PMI03_05820 [Rhizobium sp. AP16]